MLLPKRIQIGSYKSLETQPRGVNRAVGPSVNEDVVQEAAERAAQEGCYHGDLVLQVSLLPRERGGQATHTQK